MTLGACLACFNGVSLIQDHDLRCQRLQLVLQLRYKVVAGDEKLKLSAFQLAILTLQQNQTGICCCLPDAGFVVNFHAFNDDNLWQ